jgi:hypothetical protein
MQMCPVGGRESADFPPPDLNLIAAPALTPACLMPSCAEHSSGAGCRPTLLSQSSSHQPNPPASSRACGTHHLCSLQHVIQHGGAQRFDVFPRFGRLGMAHPPVSAPQGREPSPQVPQLCLRLNAVQEEYAESRVPVLLLRRKHGQTCGNVTPSLNIMIRDSSLCLHGGHVLALTKQCLQKGQARA